jgi:membrane protease subunit (stomatin/prohibitin family)
LSGFRRAQLDALQTAYNQQGIELAEVRAENRDLRRQLQDEPEDQWSERDPNRVSLRI